MLIGIILGGAIGLVVGIIIERYKWVGRCKKNKAVEVDGELYQVRKIRMKTVDKDV